MGDSSACDHRRGDTARLYSKHVAGNHRRRIVAAVVENKWLVVAVPLLIGIVLLLNPLNVRDRALSSFGAQEGVLDSRAHRAALRSVGWEMIRAHPIVGVGPEQVGPQFMQYYPADLPHPFPIAWYKEHLHNIYIHYAAERGLPALAALLWFLGRALFDFWATLRRLPAQSEARWIVHGSIAVIIAVMISGWTELTLGHSQVLEMFLAVLGCGYAAVDSCALTLGKGEPMRNAWSICRFASPAAISSWMRRVFEPSFRSRSITTASPYSI